MLPLSSSLVQSGHDQGVAADDAPAPRDLPKPLTLAEVDALLVCRLVWDEIAEKRDRRGPTHSISLRAAMEPVTAMARLADWFATEFPDSKMPAEAAKWRAHQQSFESVVHRCGGMLSRFHLQALRAEASALREEARELRKLVAVSQQRLPSARKDADGIFHPPGSASVDQRRLNDLRNGAVRAMGATSKGVPQPAHSLSSLQRRMVIDGKVVVGPPAPLPARSIGMTEATRRLNPSTDRGDPGH